MKTNETKEAENVIIEPITREIRRIGIEVEDWQPEAYRLANIWILDNTDSPFGKERLTDINHLIISKMEVSENPLNGNSYLDALKCVMMKYGLDLPTAEFEQEAKKLIDDSTEEMGWGKKKYLDIGSLCMPTETEPDIEEKPKPRKKRKR